MNTLHINDILTSLSENPCWRPKKPMLTPEGKGEASKMEAVRVAESNVLVKVTRKGAIVKLQWLAILVCQSAKQLL